MGVEADWLVQVMRPNAYQASSMVGNILRLIIWANWHLHSQKLHAATADQEFHSQVIGGDDFGSMIVRFWKHVPPAVSRLCH
jgi:hypothetical protein